MSELLVQMYALYHPDYTIQPWNTFIALVCITWLCIAATIFFNKYLPYLQHFGLFMVVVGGIVTIIVIASMPKSRASNSFVWSDFENQTGWSGGVAFLTGVLNGAFTIGTPDSVTHMAEELPNPKRDLPRAIAAQVGLGALSKLTPFIFGNSLPVRRFRKSSVNIVFSGILLWDCTFLRCQRLRRRHQLLSPFGRLLPSDQ